MKEPKLPPAPWEVKYDEPSGSHYIPDVIRGGPLLLCEDDRDPGHVASLKFAALARNAFDVMMRRGWMPMLSPREKKWGIGFPYPIGTAIPLHDDPFTALVEADQWLTAQEKAAKEVAKMPEGG